MRWRMSNGEPPRTPASGAPRTLAPAAGGWRATLEVEIERAAEKGHERSRTREARRNARRERRAEHVAIREIARCDEVLPPQIVRVRRVRRQAARQLRGLLPTQREVLLERARAARAPPKIRLLDDLSTNRGERARL